MDSQQKRRISEDRVKRAAIYAFYDKDGIVDRYVDFFLEDLCKNVERLIVVSNGDIDISTRHLLERHTKEIIERENEGFDVWAYKAALDYIGWDILSTYDEVVLVNNTLFGPVFAFAEMFDSMAQEDVDFWGITKHGTRSTEPLFSNPYGYIPEHIQSYFVVFRSKFIVTQELKNYWLELPEIKTYEDAIGKHETYFTKYFADLGFKWSVYVNPIKEDQHNNYMLMIEPRMLIENYRCPIFKRKSFFNSKDYYLENCAGEATGELLRYMSDHTDYNTDFIWENIIRTCHPCDVVNALGQINIIPRDYLIKPDANSNQQSVALCMHLYYLDLLDDSLRCASYMPEYADIYITTNTQEKVDAIKTEFSELPNEVEVRLIENRGRSESAYLVGCRDVIQSYNIVCCYHDKKSSQVSPSSIGQSFAYKQRENSLPSKHFVQNIIQFFNENPHIGMLSPTEPNFGQYYLALGREWGPNYDNVVELVNSFGLDVPLSPKKFPLASLGGVFWVRGKALKKLVERNWRYEDFPPEPNEVDGTLLHAIERIYPFVVQDAGYFPAYVLSDAFASLEITNLRHYVRSFNLLAQSKKLRGPNSSIVTKMRNLIDAKG